MDLRPFLESFSSTHTRRAYKTDLNRYLEFLAGRNGDESFPDANAADVQQFITEMQNRGLSASTQRRRLSAIRRFYDWLVEQGAYPRNPARASTISLSEERGDDPDVRFLSRKELEQIVSAAAKSAGAAGMRDRAIVLAIIYGALRRTELAALNIRDVRPLSRHWVIDLPGQSSGRGGFVKIPSIVQEAVEQTVSLYETDQGPLWQSLSNRNRGQRMSPDALYKRVRRAGRAAGVETLSIEMLRRSGLRLAAQAGARLDQIQSHARLRHPASAIRYFDSSSTASRLRNTAGDLLDLQIDGECGPFEMT
jgi:site-specific recombinase XerD